jgi:hypothetical protein
MLQHLIGFWGRSQHAVTVKQVTQLLQTCMKELLGQVLVAIVAVVVFVGGDVDVFAVVVMVSAAPSHSFAAGAQ